MINAKKVILAPASDTTNIQTDAGYLADVALYLPLLRLLYFWKTVQQPIRNINDLDPFILISIVASTGYNHFRIGLFNL